MRTSGIILLTACSVLLTASCQEKDNLFGPSENGRIGIEVDVTATRLKSGIGSSAEVLFSVPFVTDTGETMYINAVIGDYESAPLPACNETLTRGTAVTGDNIGTLPGYESFQMSVYNSGGAIYKSYDIIREKTSDMENLAVTYSGTSSWQLPAAYWWPENNDDPLDFCAWAPSAAFAVEGTAAYVGTATGLAWQPDASGKAKATFTYTLPAPMTAEEAEEGGYQDAVNQPDIIFAANRQTRSVGINGMSYAHLTFSHAMTAVRFVRGELPNCHIDKIVLKGFYSSATCTYAYDESASKYQFTWTNPEKLNTYSQTLDVELDNNVKKTGEDGMGDYMDNTTDLSYTFMMIPQALDATAKIELYVKGRLHPIELPIGSLTVSNLSGSALDNADENIARIKDWSQYAGKVINFSIGSESLNQVSVIESFSSEEKVLSDPSIENQGECTVYVRAAIVANWTDETGYTILAPYIIDGCIANHSDVFALPATATVKTETVSADWKDFWYYNLADGFYYYKYKLPGKKSEYAGEHNHSLSMPLFSSFTAPDPGPEIAVIEGVSKLKITVLYQCVDATNGKDGVIYAGWITTGTEEWLSSDEKGKCVTE